MDEKSFLWDLSNKPWEQVSNDHIPIDLAVENFTSFITDTLNKHAPLRKRPFRRKKKSPFSIELRNLQKERDKTKKEMVSHNGTINQEIYEKYKRLRNKCTKLARVEKRSSISKSENPSQGNVWRVVNSVMNSSQAPHSIPNSLTPKIWHCSLILEKGSNN